MIMIGSAIAVWVIAAAGILVALTLYCMFLSPLSLYVTDTFLGSHLSMESSIEYVCRV
jgi:hypothetical protein